MSKIVFFVIIIYIFSETVESDENSSKIPISDGKPVIVSTVLYTDDISSINDKDMDFRLDFYLKHQWNVSKQYCDSYVLTLKDGWIADTFENTNHSQTEDNQTHDIIKNDINNFWVPDTIVSNAKKVRLLSEDTRVLRIKEEVQLEICSLVFIQKLTAIISCPMDFHLYPRETVECNFFLRSYSHNKNHVHYKWDSDPTPINPDLRLLQHFIHYSNNETVYSNLEGDFSGLLATLTLKRKIINKVFQVYLPSFIIVGMSFLSLWLSLDCDPGRVTVCLFCVLAISSEFVSLRKELPRLSYITIIDMWMMGCLIFIFGTLFEFTIVKYLMSVWQKHTEELHEKSRSQLSLNTLASDQPSSASTLSIQTQMEELRPIEYPLEPGYKQYLFSVIHKRVVQGFGRNTNEVEKANYSSNQRLYPNRDMDTMPRHLRASVSSIASVAEEESDEVIWFRRVDRIARAVFPMAFVVFCLGYWITLIEIS